MRVWKVVGVVACAALIAACGGASHHSNRAAGVSRALRFSDCMREHGVPSFADPGPNGYQMHGSGILGTPAAQGAFNTCRHYLPPAGHPPPVPASVRRQEVALANCMRSHGVPNFPDPDANGDIQFPVTSPILRSPAFQRAQNGPCKQYASG